MVPLPESASHYGVVGYPPIAPIGCAPIGERIPSMRLINSAAERLMLGEVPVVSNVTFARLHGDLDRVSVDALRDLLDDIFAGPSPRLVIDLSDVGFVDVQSLSVILGTADA